MTVQEFLEKFSAESQRIVNDIFEYIDYTKQKTRGYKSMREEHIPIRAYILRKAIPKKAILNLGGESHDFDAKIIWNDETERYEEILEVIQALPEKEYVIRHALVDGIKTLEEYNISIKQIESFPQSIIDAINKKHKKIYADKRILLVSVAGEYTYEDDKLINQWIPIIRKKTILGNFLEIFLVETARYKIFKIH